MDAKIVHDTALVLDHLAHADDLDPALGHSLLAAERVPGGESLRDVGVLLDVSLPLDIDVAAHLSAGGALAPAPHQEVPPLGRLTREQGNVGQRPRQENLHVAWTPPAPPEDEAAVLQDQTPALQLRSTGLLQETTLALLLPNPDGLMHQIQRRRSWAKGQQQILSSSDVSIADRISNPLQTQVHPLHLKMKVLGGRIEVQVPGMEKSGGDGAIHLHHHGGGTEMHPQERDVLHHLLDVDIVHSLLFAAAGHPLLPQDADLHLHLPGALLPQFSADTVPPPLL